jgi:hypothetical protein
MVEPPLEADEVGNCWVDGVDVESDALELSDEPSLSMLEPEGVPDVSEVALVSDVVSVSDGSEGVDCVGAIVVLVSVLPEAPLVIDDMEL